MKSKKKVLFQFGLWTGLSVNKIFDYRDKYFSTFGVSSDIFRHLLKELIVHKLCPISILSTLKKMETQYNGHPHAADLGPVVR